MNSPVTTDTPTKTEGNGCCADCHRILGELEPYLPLLAKAAAMLDNPAARFRDRLRKGERQ